MKNFIKKIGAVFLSLTVTASLFAGCGAKTERAQRFLRTFTFDAVK